MATPKFIKSIIQNGRKDGYWLETFWADPKDKFPSLIGYGLLVGEVYLFDNPRNAIVSTGDEEWKKYLLAKLNSPVSGCSGNFAGNGLNDLVICHEFGTTAYENNPSGGHITWLENPGRNADGTLQVSWKQRFIGRWPAMHRLDAGYYTQRTHLEIVAIPIIRGPFDIHTPIPVLLFQRNETSLLADDIEWERSVIDEKSFTVAHECVTKRFESRDGLDSMFIASREGINWLYWDNDKWKKQHIHDGMPKVPGKDYYGCASVDVGKVGSDPSAYIMTIDPFNGTTVTALVKRHTGPGTYEWVRHVLDEYGTPKQLEHEGNGPGHHVLTADFDGDGDDECLVGLFGPDPYKGVYYYKVKDLEKGIFEKWKVADESAARIAIGFFTGGKGLDFATIGFKVGGYYEEEHPKIHLYKHDFRTQAVDSTLDVVFTARARPTTSTMAPSRPTTMMCP